MSYLTIHPPADRILQQVTPALLKTLHRDEIRIGGGTALAARWNHRRSTDIDMTVSPESLKRISPEIREILTAASITDIRQGLGWLKGICDDGEFSISTTDPLLPSSLAPQDREQRFGIGLEPTAEILARKLRLRMYGNGEFVSRDLYDIRTAHEQDPAALDLALSVLTEDMAQEIANEIAHMGQQAKQGGRPLTNVHHTEWIDSLATDAADLITAYIGMKKERAPAANPPDRWRMVPDPIAPWLS